jgi:vitamin B12 transporter
VPGFARIYTNHFNQDFNGTYKSRRQGFQYQTGWQANEQHKIVTGLDLEKGEVISSTAWDGSVNYNNKSVTNTAIYLQDIYSIADKWTVTPGLRYDHHNKFGGQTTPKINVNYSADANTDIYVSYNRVFNAPNLDDLYTPYIPGDPDPDYGYGATYGNPNLKPEKGYVVSAGVNKKLDEKTSVKVNYFSSKINDAIDWYPINGDLNDQFADWSVLNIDQQKKHGVELDIHHKLSDKYYTNLGYSYIHVENTLTIAPLTNSQPNGYRVKIGYNDNQWDWNLNGQSATGRDTTRYVDSGYWVWNLSTNYKVTQDAKVYFNVYNLGNKAYEIVSGGSGGRYPMPARHFQMGVKYSF